MTTATPVVPGDYIRGGQQKSTYHESDVVEWPCPLCGGTDVAVIKYERGVLRIVRCKDCDLIRVSPRLERPEEIYQGDAALYEQEFREVVYQGRPHHRDPNYIADVALIEKYQPTGKFLDVGAATGAFLRHARGKGWELTGVEPSPSLGSLARKWWGLHILEGFLETLGLPDKEYDVVTMTDVFEHIVNPKEVLGSVHRILKDDGIVFVKVPNGLYNILKYRARKAMGRAQADDFDAYEHVLHYTEDTLVAMLRACHFEPMRIEIETPVQIPVWHKHVGQYFQHASPFLLDWKTYSAREIMYQMAKIEYTLTRKIGYLAPSIGVIARKVQPS